MLKQEMMYYKQEMEQNMVINAALAKQIADNSANKNLKKLQEESFKQVLDLINLAANTGLYNIEWVPEHKNENVIEFVRTELLDLNFRTSYIKGGLSIRWEN